MNRLKPIRPLLGILLTIAIAQPRAWAVSPEAQARLHFDAGQKRVAEGRFADALAEFEVGYQLSHRPLFLFNMAECARRAGDTAHARQLYEQYLRDEPNGSVATNARQRLDELGPAPASTAAPAAPTPAPEPEPEPRHSRVAPAVHSEPAPSVAPARAPQPATNLISTDTPPPPKPLYKRWQLWVGVSAAAVVVVTAISLGVVFGTQSSCSAGTSCLSFHP